MHDVLVCIDKKNGKITISKDGKKLIINKSHVLFDTLFPLTKEEIIDWYSKVRTNT